MKIFIIALFIRTSNLKYWCSLIGRKVNKMRYIHTMKHNTQFQGDEADRSQYMPIMTNIKP